MDLNLLTERTYSEYLTKEILSICDSKDLANLAQAKKAKDPSKNIGEQILK
jgi:hypothetical protein